MCPVLDPNHLQKQACDDAHQRPYRTPTTSEQEQASKQTCSCVFLGSSGSTNSDAICSMSIVGAVGSLVRWEQSGAPPNQGCLQCVGAQYVIKPLSVLCWCRRISSSSISQLNSHCF